jgi:hypothetical protein
VAGTHRAILRKRGVVLWAANVMCQFSAFKLFVPTRNLRMSECGSVRYHTVSPSILINILGILSAGRNLGDAPARDLTGLHFFILQGWADSPLDFRS